MKIICPKELLMNNINIVSKAVSTKSTLQILECILITATENSFIMISNDLEMGIETANINSTIIESGSVALESKVFSEIIRKMPDGDITITSDEKNVTVINSGKVEFKILGLNSDEFPYLPLVEKANGYKITTSEFKNMIKQTIFSVSYDASKLIFTGELLEIENDILNVVAVDGFRISLRTAAIEGNDENTSVIVPGKTLNELSKILPSATGEDDFITFYFTDKHILFETKDYTFISRLIDGEYLKYKQSFSDDFSTLVKISRNEMLHGLERSILISREDKKTPVKFEIKKNNLIITSNTEMGTSYEEIAIDLEGEELLISFNPKYLIDALKAIEEETIAIQFTTPLSPCILKGTKDESFKYLILPLRLKS